MKDLMKALTFGSIGVGAWYILGLPKWQSALTAFAAYLFTGGWRFTKVVLMTLPRDLGGLIKLIDIKKQMKNMEQKDLSVVDLFDETVKKYPNKKALIMANGKEMTFREVQEYSYKIACWIRKEGYQPGDSISLFMMGCPEYVCWWLGMSRVSVVPALINFNLRNESLTHCIQVAESKAMVYGTELAAAVAEIEDSLNGIPIYSFGPEKECPGRNVEEEVKNTSTDEKIPTSVKPGHKDRLLYIYTSGTTGLPKAAVIKHYRFFYMAYSSGKTFGITSKDIIYDTLPLYHSAGGILGPGQMLLRGTTVVVRPKFSASQYWTDCIQYGATAGQYIGETCRYLLAQPVKPTDKQHKVTRMFGNGIRPQIWREFQDRFNIKYIMEFYGATEGNSNIVNYPGQVGAIGFTTRIAPSLFPVSLVKVDSDGVPIRDGNGLCIHCEPGEPGELVGKIGKEVIRRFDGYVGEKETKKKITTDVFRKGDRAFLTGDILVMDDYGYFYFKDRSGDTYRWKGENVSTLEVEGVVHNILKYKDAVVFGVEVPGNEGRAGMAAIAAGDDLNLDNFCKDLQGKLPAYARPVFVRLLEKVDTTGTFKLIKKNYVDAGFDPSKTTDALYYLDGRQGVYKKIDPQVYTDICNGNIRL